MLDGSRWNLSPDLLEPNRAGARITAVSMSEPAPGKFRFEMSELFAGWVEVKIRGETGDEVIINISSRPDLDCEFNQRNEYIVGASGEGRLSKSLQLS